MRAQTITHLSYIRHPLLGLIHPVFIDLIFKGGKSVLETLDELIYSIKIGFNVQAKPAFLNSFDSFCFLKLIEAHKQQAIIHISNLFYDSQDLSKFFLLIVKLSYFHTSQDTVCD